MNRAALRSSLLATVPRRSKLLTVTINGAAIELELRQPTLAERDSMMAAAQAFANREAQKKDPAAQKKNPAPDVPIPNGVLIIHTLIGSAYVPGTDERVFEPADAGVLLQAGIGGWVEDVVAATSSLVSKEAEEVGKPSAETSSA